MTARDSRSIFPSIMIGKGDGGGGGGGGGGDGDDDDAGVESVI